ncbi:phage tail tube protein [Saccharopolyspora shandongensis]|uniref:Uncharacterized protein n=1 Tax=Saccharopolyspora shandongensis TaxID=418495 RepID=A0A1H3TLT8_9PSEU|nr:hypothetical protein [Saccharopolyspora shandongensis]SDZ51214.1 hypothetical protein SAMN05216215_108714 [Saccharopolyspora shandongensis]
MTLNAELARLGVTGALLTGPVGTAAPTDLATWASGMVDLGYISDDGITESRDENSESFTPWQSNAPIRVETTSSVVTFGATLWESNFDTVSLYYRVGLEDMTQTGTGDDAVVSFAEKGKPKRDLRAFGIDVIDGTYHRRIFLPYAEVTERGEITYRSNTLIGYQVTITAYPGSDGTSVLRLFKEGWTLPTPPAG